MQKKVVLAISSLQGNGAERFVLILAKALKDLGHEPHVVYFRNIIELPLVENIQYHHFPFEKYRIIPKFMRTGIVAKAFDQFVLEKIGQPDLVLSNLYPIDVILAHSQLPNVHMVIHNTTTQEYQDKLTPKFVKKLAKVYLSKPCVGVSEGVTQDFKQLFGEKSHITTIYNPIDLEQVQVASAAFKPEYNHYIVNVGKFKAQKRHDVLIKAYAKAGISQKLVLVGTGKLMETSKQLAKDLKIEDKIIFAGFQTNPYVFIKNSDLMVVSSDFEGFSIAILEALALDTPVISTDCPSGPSEVLNPHQLVPVQDIDALAAKIREAAENPAKFHQVLDNKFLPHHAVKQYLDLIGDQT